MTIERLASASFTISGDHVEPEWWTLYFGVTPDTALKKGELHRFTDLTEAEVQAVGEEASGIWEAGQAEGCA